MMKNNSMRRNIIEVAILSVIVFIAANFYVFRKLMLKTVSTTVLVLLIIIGIVYIIMPSFILAKKHDAKLRMCYNGCVQLTTFIASTVLTGVYAIYMIVKGIPFHPELSMSPLFFLGYMAFAIIIEAIVFWAGIIRVYLSSTQIRIKWRVIGILCGMIPVVHLFVLFHILRLAYTEVYFEEEKIEVNKAREEEKICQTKYPIVLVHGVFFRDSPLLNYWGRIPEELEKNGATIYYGNQQSALSVAESADELADRIKQVLKKTKSEKVNIIAHSKGGLDSRYAIDKYGMSECVASLTTINTPHRGCEFADFLLSVIPDDKQKAIAKAYNSALKKLGDDTPDFIAAITDLTANECRKRNEEIKDSEKVYYQSFGSCLKKPESGRFPLNMTTSFVKYFDGKNDGLVGEESFPWGENYKFLENSKKRGISHADMIDLNRENIPGFDVREFYVGLVADLKKRGF